jgi:hypothetical protein
VTTFPNFLIIGAAKSGTYTLFHQFERHPQVRMCRIKEPHYFSYGAGDVETRTGPRGPVEAYVNSREAYLQLFPTGPDTLLAGESSVSYLYVPGTAERIFEFNTQMKLIVSLRHPVQRAYSSFNYAKSYGLEPLRTLDEGLRAEAERIRNNLSILLRYRDLGMYAEQLERYYNVFPRDQIKVILFEELAEEPVRVIRELFDFAGVASDFPADPDMCRNISRRPDDDNPLHRIVTTENIMRSAVRKLLPMAARRRLRNFVRDSLFRPPPPLAPGERRRYLPLFADDIHRLQDLLNRDLSAWLK